MDSNGLDLLWDHYQLEGHTGHLWKKYNLAPRPCLNLTLSTSSRGPLRKRKNQILSSEWGKLFVKKLAVT